ncbi:chemotaxis protein CheW [Cryptosporangium aurantiacum]|uniref:Purine-binding chemotaxis protein CheW n=1 Tax=Cryptosporangium aurantiacum TaxID=134849 RepID=A0A1M7RGS3_9ACTN|nr:chemotaxis protein CheW [Cryptosporangium aurantiacum]SHN45372.1 purine-binding chemotaxis protein CheW [Cryptosporangium aurantiacum]
MGSPSTTPQADTRRDPSAAESDRYLRFTLNGDMYALNIFNVTEILEHRQLTPVPMMPDFIRGVINLRGRVVPVIDLAIRFGRGVTTIARRTCIIIVRITNPAAESASPDDDAPAEAGTQDIGILVDVVNKVVRLADDEIEPPPAFGAGIRADYISGMAKRDDDFVIVLDVSRVLSISDMVSLQNATADPVAAEAAARSSRTS